MFKSCLNRIETIYEYPYDEILPLKFWSRFSVELSLRKISNGFLMISFFPMNEFCDPHTNEENLQNYVKIEQKKFGGKEGRKTSS